MKKYIYEKQKGQIDPKKLAERMERMAHDLRAGRDPIEENCKVTTHELSRKCVEACHEAALGDSQLLLTILPNVIASIVVSCFFTACPRIPKSKLMEGINILFKETLKLIEKNIDVMAKEVSKDFKQNDSRN